MCEHGNDAANGEVVLAGRDELAHLLEPQVCLASWQHELATAAAAVLAVLAARLLPAEPERAATGRSAI